MDYAGLLAQANLQTCDPMDSTCVSNNVAKQAVVEDLWVSKYMSQQGGAPADTVLTFAPQSVSEVKEFYDPSVVGGGSVVDTRGILAVNNVVAPSDFGKTAAQFFQPVAPVVPSAHPPVVIQQPVVTSPTPSPSGGAPAMPPGTSAAAGAAASSSLVIGGFDLGSIPWWGWVAGAGAAFFALGGGRGR
jgi:hypothetical protein